MKFKPANNIQDLQYVGEFGVVNASISDSSTISEERREGKECRV